MRIILIILLGVCLFAYFSIRKATLNPGTEERECQDKEKYKELLKKEKLEEVFATLDIAQGDINNIKILEETYDLTTIEAQNLWERIKKIKIRDEFSDIKKIVDYSQGDIANIKIIKDYYKIDLKTAKELWDSIRNQKER